MLLLFLVFKCVFEFKSVFVFKCVFERPRFGRSWHQGWRSPKSRAKSAGCIFLASALWSLLCILDLGFVGFCISTLYLFRFRFGVVWGRNKGGVTLAAIRIRTFGDICIWNFTAHDKSLDYRKIAALPRNQAHLHGNQCKMNSIFQIAILTSKKEKT